MLVAERFCAGKYQRFIPEKKGKPINTLCGQNTGTFSAKKGDTYSSLSFERLKAA
jgi:hypothetical protein